MDRSRVRSDFFKPAEFLPHINSYIHDDISGIVDPLMTEFPNTTEEAIMNRSNFQYDDIRVGNKGAHLNYNLVGIYNDYNCYYQHTKAKPTPERIKVVKWKLEPAISSYIKEEAGG